MKTKSNKSSTTTSLPKRLRILSLFDESGVMGQPWADAGHYVMCIDLLNRPRRENGIHYVKADLFNDKIIEVLKTWKPDIIFAFPPCTDLAVSGAAHFEKKRKADPDFQKKAMKLFVVGAQLGQALGVPYMIENPVSVASTLWRKPDFSFHPYEYGGYIPFCQRQHPIYPNIIPDRDAYQKKTCMWVGNGFVKPETLPVVPMDRDASGHSVISQKTGGKSAKTKHIRSMTPRGWAMAVFKGMEPLLNA